MKKQLLFILLLGLLSCNQKQKDATYKVMTYNIRYDNPNDGDNNWHKRKVELANQIQQQNPDILGIQEGLAHQVAYLDSTLAAYSYVGVGREDGKTQGEYAAIFYKKEKWTCIKNSTFWLSERPDTISVGWDAALERICTYVLLENNESKKKLWALNIHFDHQGKLARENSAELLLNKITALQKEEHCPIILTGDFNSTPNETPIKLLSANLDNAYLQKKQKSEATYNDFNLETPATNKIDYIFTKGLTVSSTETLAAKRTNGRYFSDHFPIVGLFNLKEK